MLKHWQIWLVKEYRICKHIKIVLFVFYHSKAIPGVKDRSDVEHNKFHIIFPLFVFLENIYCCRMKWFHRWLIGGFESGFRVEFTYQFFDATNSKQSIFCLYDTKIPCSKHLGGITYMVTKILNDSTWKVVNSFPGEYNRLPAEASRNFYTIIKQNEIQHSTKFWLGCCTSICSRIVVVYSLNYTDILVRSKGLNGVTSTME